MADFTGSDTKRGSVKKAFNLLDNVRGVYAHLVLVRDMIALYQAGTDPAFNATINIIHPADQRQEIGQIATKMANLAADLEKNHPSAIGLTG